MDEIVWALNPKNDTLKEIANYLVFFAEDFLRPSGIACCLDVALGLPHIPVTAEVRHNIFMVVKETLNNAVKHAKAQEIRFGLNYADNKLTVEIADNGRGFCIKKTVGNGLEYMQKRMSAIGGQFHFRNTQTVRLPTSIFPATTRRRLSGCAFPLSDGLARSFPAGKTRALAVAAQTGLRLPLDREW